MHQPVNPFRTGDGGSTYLDSLPGPAPNPRCRFGAPDPRRDKTGGPIIASAPEETTPPRRRRLRRVLLALGALVLIAAAGGGYYLFTQQQQRTQSADDRRAAEALCLEAQVAFRDALQAGAASGASWPEAQAAGGQAQQAVLNEDWSAAAALCQEAITLVRQAAEEAGGTTTP